MMRRNTCSSDAPSMRAASMISSGIALMAADSTTMANPVCIQIMITMSSRLFHGRSVSHAHRLVAEALPDAVQQPDVRAEPLGSVAVDQAERDGGADERDRHRQEDERLGDRLAAAQPVGQRGEDEADAHRDQRHEHDPQRGVADRAQHALVGEDELVVVEPDAARRRWRP